LTTLFYLSTAILTISSLHHVLAAKKARDKSLHPPSFGLDEGKEGVLVALNNSKESERGVVVQMELRRKSGRGVVETFVLSPGSSIGSRSKAGLSEIMLLDEHPAYAPPVLDDVLVSGSRDGEDGEEGTFNLQLTEKQRRAREGVVLPYFDAQSEGGVGEGGRILYEMGEEDREDFDDEEDEI
jgi:elongator complex protein 5